MTLGFLLPLALAVLALIELPLLARLRNTGRLSQSSFAAIALLSVALPFAAYLALNLAFPEIGAIPAF